MADPRDYKLDLSSLSKPEESKDEKSGRPFLSVQFACCGVYQRIYKNAEGTAYVGHCPKCAKPVRFAVGPGGTTARQFVVE
jgi:hypothetical protein